MAGKIASAREAAKHTDYRHARPAPSQRIHLPHNVIENDSVVVLFFLTRTLAATHSDEWIAIVCTSLNTTEKKNLCFHPPPLLSVPTWRRLVRTEVMVFYTWANCRHSALIWDTIEFHSEWAWTVWNAQPYMYPSVHVHGQRKYQDSTKLREQSRAGWFIVGICMCVRYLLQQNTIQLLR